MLTPTHFIFNDKHCLYWRPNSQEYTPNLIEAGLYPYEDALRHCRPEQHERPIALTAMREKLLTLRAQLDALLTQ